MTLTYAQDYQRVSPNGDGKAWLAELRRKALDRFEATGFPTTRDEDWKFVNLAPLTSRVFPAAATGMPLRPDDLAPYQFAIPGSRLLAFVNGRFEATLSDLTNLPDGLTIAPLASALASDADLVMEHLGRYAKADGGGFTALNTALASDGLLVHVRAGADAGPPIHALFLSDENAAGKATHPRSLVIVGRGARASVIESYVGLGSATYFTNAVTEVVVGEGAFLEHIKIQREAEAAYHVGTTHIRHGRESRGVSHSVSFGAALCRNNLDVVLDGPGVEAQMLGLYLGSGRQEVDNHTSLLHAHPSCSTREIYKGILDGRAHGVFNGKIYVTPLAQKTDAKQTNRALLLSDEARVDTKPQLEIFADDVKCTHGATVGNLDQAAAFYLKSRGIGGALARRILTYAFAAEVLEELPYQPVREVLEALVMDRLQPVRGRE
ncbi:MAG TPA: Fe-S cluster assembly protein SufD [Gemmatimonadales bacterium]|nr:Fe-S cluster assembly protein SufD [Gemmatimonadales bacterium]